MRAFVLLLALVAGCGCTSSRNSQRTPEAQTRHDTLVVMENPTISERLRVNQQQKAAQESTAQVEVEGAVNR